MRKKKNVPSTFRYFNLLGGFLTLPKYDLDDFAGTFEAILAVSKMFFLVIVDELLSNESAKQTQF